MNSTEAGGRHEAGVTQAAGGKHAALGLMMADAASGKPVYISTVHAFFASLPAEAADRIVLRIRLLDSDGAKSWELRLPRLGDCGGAEREFIGEYVRAEIYNILSSIGARSMTIFVDPASRECVELAEGMNGAFCVDRPRGSRTGYGRAVNVLDRMMAAVRPGESRFRFEVRPLSELPGIEPAAKDLPKGAGLAFFRRCTEGLGGRAFCGIDVGGTDIKAVLVDSGRIVGYKEYDWFPASFIRSRQLVDPICLIVRLLLARLRLDRATLPEPRRGKLLGLVAAAMDRKADDGLIEETLGRLEAEGSGDESPLFDGIGLCFPDVVVQNKIVGGEVYKTRGIRNNPGLDYESDFAELTDLDLRLRTWVKPDGKVRIINDGPMASFTAAVEIAASPKAGDVANGVFAHTLGTELGTGWVTETGAIPDIPLEVYNYIIDLGSGPERAWEPDDLRSVNNFNTGLPGTLQKYCSQSGVFRLAMKYFPAERPDLFRELQDRGFIEKRKSGGAEGWYVPTEPVDQRKPFLEHMMTLPDRERDETNRRIWREIGEFLAVTFLETRRILDPGTDERFLFGRLVKNSTCFDLMLEGGRRIKPDLSLVVAGTGMANTPLMKELEADAEYTVAQFAQAIGAVYFANSRA